jgi:hypothetical protein
MRLISCRLLPAVLLACAAYALVAADADAPDAERSTRPSRPHVVLLILDELPGDSLLDERGRIDPGRYPNLAAFAARATWFRNAYSVYDSTACSQPSSRLPRRVCRAFTLAPCAVERSSA